MSRSCRMTDDARYTLHRAPPLLGRGPRRPMETFLFVLIILASIPRDSRSENHEIRELLRSKRTLLFPNPLASETKVQVLFGLGLPMEGEVSMTLGYVLKCNYVLPYNASELRDEPYVRYVRDVDEEQRDETPEDFDSREKKSRKKGGSGISRWSLYRILEMALDSVVAMSAGIGTSSAMGKACLLRAICEAAETSFHDDGTRGLAGQLFHVFFTPSTTDERHELRSDRDYTAAELVGRNSNGLACRFSYPECPYSPLDYFTKGSATLGS